MLITAQSLLAHEAPHSDQGCTEDVVVRRPAEADVPSLAILFAEMQSHYNRPVSDAAATKAAALACTPPANVFDPRVLVALVGDAIIGSIVMNVTFPAFELSLSLHIRDLYVAQSMRRRGVGRLLVKAGARLAVREGFSALEWTTDTANAAARKMYEICGAKQLDRTYYRLFDDTFRCAAD